MPPFTGVAVNVTELPGQILLEDAAMFTEGMTASLTVMVSWLLVTDAGEGQTAFEVITTVILSPFTKDDDENVALLAPMLLPFNFHWYEGAVPPLAGVAVKVTEVPEQIFIPGLALISTDGVTVGVIVTVVVEVAEQLFASVTFTV